MKLFKPFSFAYNQKYTLIVLCITEIFSGFFFPVETIIHIGSFVEKPNVLYEEDLCEHVGDDRNTST